MTNTRKKTDSGAHPSAVILIPTYNERENLHAMFEQVHAALPSAMMLVIDDNSPDGTGQLAEQLARQHPGLISVLHRTRKEGLGAAYVAGYRYALQHWPNAQWLIQMDADLSHDPAYLPAMIDSAGDADVVVGSRYVHGISIVNWPLHRLIVSKLGTAFARSVTGLPLTDCTSGFKCYRSDVLRNIGLEKIRSNGYVFQIETSFRAWRLGYALRDFPIVFRERRAGASKLNLGIALEAFSVTLRLGLERWLRRGKQLSHGSGLKLDQWRR
jgi:dolichol-phosphate mannosyltransferase